MRIELKKRVGMRDRYTATFQKFGQRVDASGQEIVTMCFENVTDSIEAPVAGHIWLDYEEPFWALDLQPGDTVQFEARVTRYQKGYLGNKAGVVKPVRHDYRLMNPSCVRKIGGNNA